MAINIEILSAPNPEGKRNSRLAAAINMLDDYDGDGEQLLAELQAALEARFADLPMDIASCHLAAQQITSTSGLYTATYDDENDRLNVRNFTDGSASWQAPINVAGDVAEIPDGVRTVLAVEATAGAATGHKAIEQAAGPAIEMTAAWTDAIAVGSHVGNVPVGTAAIQAVEATAGGTAGPVTILHTAAAATQCNVDVGAGTVTFAAGDAVTEMRCLICSQPHPGAVEIDYTAGTVTFDAADDVTECAMLTASDGIAVPDTTDLTDTVFLVEISYEREI